MAVFPVKKICGVPNMTAAAMLALERLDAGAACVVWAAAQEEDFQEFAAAAAGLRQALGRKPPELLTWGSEPGQRAEALRRLYDPAGLDGRILLIPAVHLADKVMPPGEFSGLGFALKPGLSYPRAELLRRIEKAGYERSSFVETRGEYAVRGSVIDLFPPGAEKPLRLFFTDALESIRPFDIETQHTAGFLTEFFLPPAFARGEAALTSVPPLAGAELLVPRAAEPELPAEAAALPRLVYGDARTDDAEEDFGARAVDSCGADIKLAAAGMARLSKGGSAVYLFCMNRGERERLGELLLDLDADKYCALVTAPVAEGFILQRAKLAFLATSEIFQRRYRQAAGARAKAKFFKWADLKVGDFVVHEDYGVGRYLGLKKLAYKAGEEQVDEAECLQIEYAKGDKLMVPLHDFSRVQKYISSEGKGPRLSHMDTKTWRELKGRVKKEVEQLARDILKLEAERGALRTGALPDAGHLEEEFAASFPYEETPDQESAIADVLGDLQQPKPMNRLVVGDVGFGKTEVAMRAAARAVFNGRQVAVLVPTTILADQHHRNFTNRFREFPVRVRSVSRFLPKPEQKKVLAEVAAGTCDIVIGTHRLLQKDSGFANLGLVVIDEEHRFGVKDKDRLKVLSKGVHLLTLSATPIPRTLYQSVSTLKPMSVIESPPMGRLPISTFVRPYDPRLTAEAVNQELARGGQVYYVYNRVQTMATKLAELQKLMPNLRAASIHGQMKAEEVEERMWDFLNRKYDLLLASTIIESGIDIPSVNTLIVENAHELGLAQLYQLRGRIGREKQKAYCWLFFPGWMKPKTAAEKAKEAEGKKKGRKPDPAEEKRKRRAEGWGLEESLAAPEIKEKEARGMTEDAMKRLSALEEFTELGSGFRLAMRDLEIRGAGELLGVRQHGFINTIGLDMYIKLLNSEIARLRGKAEEELAETSIDLSLPAYIPEDYVGDDMERLNFYKKLLNAPAGRVEAVIAEFEDISGPAPQPLKNLAGIIRFKKTLSAHGVRSVAQKGDAIEIFFHPKSPVDAAVIGSWHKFFGDRLGFIPSRFGDGVRIAGVADPLADVGKAVAAFPEKKK